MQVINSDIAGVAGAAGAFDQSVKAFGSFAVVALRPIPVIMSAFDFVLRAWWAAFCLCTRLWLSFERRLLWYRFGPSWPAVWPRTFAAILRLSTCMQLFVFGSGLLIVFFLSLDLLVCWDGLL